MGFNREISVWGLYEVALPDSYDFICHTSLIFQRSQVLNNGVRKYNIEFPAPYSR